MTAVALALLGAVLFGAMAASLGVSFQRSSDAEAGALVTGLVALAVTLVFSLDALSDIGDLWPFLLAGLIAPGGSHMLYVMAVKEVGASRAAVIAGAGPLVAVTIALTILGEPFEVALVLGAMLIVLGVVALAGERDRPEHLRFIGLVLALASTVFFATRDNVVRWLAEDTPVDPQLAAATTLVSGSAVMAAYLLFLRGRSAPGDVLRAFRPFALPGVFWGMSYAAIFEAFYRGRVSVVSPLIATEALFGVLLAAIVIGRSELIGRHVIAAAGLIVCGGILIGAFQ
jgi:drug/metabolite transporter (DMT)-like permease